MIIFACVLGAIGAPTAIVPLLMPPIRDPLIKQYGPSIIPMTATLVVVSLIALVGYWRMRRWGVYLWTAVVLASMAYGAKHSVPVGINFLGPIFITFVGFYYLARMT